MKIVLFTAHLFKRRKIKVSLFSSALKEAVNDTFKEMGYEPGKNNEKNEYYPRHDPSKFTLSDAMSTDTPGICKISLE
jgi:hypothetical protein